MIDPNIFAYFISGAATLLSIMGLWVIAIIPGLDSWSKRFFWTLFSTLLLLCMAGLIETALYNYENSSGAITFTMTVEIILLALPPPMLTVYLLHSCGEDFRSAGLLHVVLILWAIFFVVIVSAPFLGGFYYISPENQYYSGPRYPLILLPIIGIVLLNIAGVIKRRKRLSYKTFISFLIALIPIAVTVTVQIFVNIYQLVDMSIVLAVLSMYSIILSDQIDQDLRHQREIARNQLEIANQRASIMVLQMRPHFIYNTMTSIYCLCDQDPKLARQVVMDFTTYLRKNFTAIASENTIPFTSELEHTRAYLAVEQAQFSDSLFVEYDTPHIWFRVPPLTLQPIVENAVKHGRDPYAGPFHISIKTRKTDAGSEIIVADDGRGFKPGDDSGPHIALKNIQQRLELMCGGSLSITPNEGRGTVVTVTIPGGDQRTVP